MHINEQQCHIINSAWDWPVWPVRFVEWTCVTTRYSPQLIFDQLGRILSSWSALVLPGTNALLSQFMDRWTDVGEITPRRRMLSLGGGLFQRSCRIAEVHGRTLYSLWSFCGARSRDAGGPNIGLISSLCVCAKINDLGFIETPLSGE